MGFRSIPYGARPRAPPLTGQEPGERRSRIELELKTGNFQRRSDIRERVTYNYVAHSLIVFFRGLFPVPQLKHDDEDAPHFLKQSCAAHFT